MLELGLTALGFGLDILVLDFYPLDGTESIDPSADEVSVLPCSPIGSIVGETRESP